MPNMYTKRHLLQALEAANLPHSYKSLLKYEKQGIIPRSNNAVDFDISNNRWRLYTKSEIETIVKKIKEYKNNGKS